MASTPRLHSLKLEGPASGASALAPPDSFKTEYHPKSGQPTVVYQFSAFTHATSQPQLVDKEPWCYGLSPSQWHPLILLTLSDSFTFRYVLLWLDTLFVSFWFFQCRSYWAVTPCHSSLLPEGVFSLIHLCLLFSYLWTVFFILPDSIVSVMCPCLPITFLLVLWPSMLTHTLVSVVCCMYCIPHSWSVQFSVLLSLKAIGFELRHSNSIWLDLALVVSQGWNVSSWVPPLRRHCFATTYKCTSCVTLGVHSSLKPTLNLQSLPIVMLDSGRGKHRLERLRTKGSQRASLRKQGCRELPRQLLATISCIGSSRLKVQGSAYSEVRWRLREIQVAREDQVDSS